jgi:hypothetical protein
MPRNTTHLFLELTESGFTLVQLNGYLRTFLALDAPVVTLLLMLRLRCLYDSALEL